MFSTVLERLNQRRAAEFELEASAEEGFTLIELMVVLLIMGILLAIAIPTFLGVTGSANDRSAQSNLNTTLTSGKAIYEQQGQIYPLGATDGTATSLASLIKANEPSLPIVTTTGTTGQGSVSAVTSTGGNGAVYYGMAKKTGMCWWVADNTAAIASSGNIPWVGSGTVATTGVPVAVGTFYGVFDPGTAGACDAATIGAATFAAGGTVSTTTGPFSTTGFPPS